MKWLVKSVCAVLVLVAIGLAIILVPAHLQVREIAPALPSEQELLALKADEGPISASYVLTSSQALARGQISHISILLEWPNGEMFMIDAGMDGDEAKSFAELLSKMDSSAGDATVYGTVSQLLGPSIEQVAGVGFTHLHIDHTQGLNDFCAVRGQGALGLQTSSQLALHNFNTEEGADIVENSCLEMHELKGDGLVQFDRFPGLAAFQLGGHTPGSTLWAAAIGNKVLLFSGDITNDKASIDNNTPKSALYSNFIVPENTNRTEELRTWLKMLDATERFSVIVSHDLASTKAHIPQFVIK